MQSSVKLNEEIHVAIVDEEQSAILNPIDDMNPIDEIGDDVTSTEDSDDSETCSDSETLGSEDDKILMTLGLSDMENESSHDSDVDEDRNDKGSFRVLWEMMMQWTTPLTIELFCQYNNIQRIQTQSDGLAIQDRTDSNDNEQAHDNHSRNTIDVGSSRRAGITNMIRMNISRSINELKLQHDFSDRRSIEKRLADLVNTFDCSGPAADFDMKLWRGMTTVLIAIVLPVRSDDDTSALQLPKSIVNLGLMPEEYIYLTQRALIDLNQN